jgi:hypothetical protein
MSDEDTWISAVYPSGADERLLAPIGHEGLHMLARNRSGGSMDPASRHPLDGTDIHLLQETARQRLTGSQ